MPERRLPLTIRAVNGALRPFGPRLWTLSPERLKRRARRRTGLADFDAGAPLDEPLAALCADLEGGPSLHPLGRYVVSRTIENNLVHRLRLVRLVAQRPEIFAGPVTAPLVIVGLPRSGTTLLHRLIARDPQLRSAPFWELLNPILPDVSAGRPADPDRRIRDGALALRYANWVAPDMRRMHKVRLDEPEEELQALAMGFASAYYSTVLPGPPRFSEWYHSADHAAGYLMFRRTLQAMQWTRPGPVRWVLKCPSHLHHMSALRSAFPGAVVLQTHRDPVVALVSLTSMITYVQGTYYDRPDPHRTGQVLSDFVESGLRAITRYRDGDGAGFVDVPYRALLADPIATLRRCYAEAGLRLEPDAERRMCDWLARNPQHQSGRHRYAAADFGLDVVALRKRFAFYYERYGVDIEPDP